MSSQKTYRLYWAIPVAISILIALVFHWSNGPYLSNILLFILFSLFSTVLYLICSLSLGIKKHKHLNSFRAIVFVNTVLLSINFWMPADKNVDANLHVHGLLLEHIHYTDQLQSLSEDYEQLQMQYTYSSLQERDYGIYSNHSGESPLVDLMSYAGRISKLKAEAFSLLAQYNKKAEPELQSSIDSIRFYKQVESGFMVYFSSFGLIQQYNQARLNGSPEAFKVASYDLEAKNSPSWGDTLSIRSARQEAAQKFLNAFEKKQANLTSQIIKPVLNQEASPVVDFQILALLILIASFLVWLLRPIR